MPDPAGEWSVEGVEWDGRDASSGHAPHHEDERTDDAVARHGAGPLPVEPFLESIGGTDIADEKRLPVSSVIVPEAEWRERERRNLQCARARELEDLVEGGAAELLQIKPSTLESRMKAFAIRKP